MKIKNFLILHGWGSGAKNWSQVKELLENQGYKVFVPDLPGFGENSSPTQAWLLKETPSLFDPALPSEAWSIDDYAEWVRSYCEKHNLSQVFLLGHSFGGSIATKFTIRHPEKVQKLFLVGCAGIRRKSIKKRIIKKAAKFFKHFSCLPCYLSIRKVLYRIFLKSDYLAVEKSVMKKTYQNVIDEDISSQFSKIFVPTILIWGKKDKLTPIKDAYYIKNAISGAKLEVLPDIFHNPQSENPKLLVDKILENLTCEVV